MNWLENTCNQVLKVIAGDKEKVVVDKIGDFYFIVPLSAIEKKNEPLEFPVCFWSGGPAV